MSWFDHNLITEFTSRAAEERAKQAHADKRRDKEREDAKDARADANANDLLSVVEQAAELREIEERLDKLELQVAEALQRNTEELEATRERIDLMLSQAIVLPDGRRVFKTEDGTQVFDEHGEEISPGVVDPDSIDDDLATWEEFQTQLEKESELLAKRDKLHDLQDRLDQAQEGVENGDLTSSELDDLEAEFGAFDAPEPVAQEMSNAPKAQGSTPHSQTQFQPNN